MIGQTVRNASDPADPRTEKMHDLLIVSSFGLWALLLGLAPVVAFRLLMGTENGARCHRG
jgi:hypothetical protein